MNIEEKAKEILRSKLTDIYLESYLKGSPLIYNACLEAVKEAINYTHSCTELFCLDNTDADGLTLHKRYKFINEDETNSLIIDDYGGNKAYLSNRFVKVIK